MQNNNTSEINIREFANLYFKLANTDQTIIYNIPDNLCIANFIEYVKNNAYTDFNISRNLQIEIVEAGQDIPGVLSEDAPALQRDFHTTIRQRYNGVYNNRAFYIRIQRSNTELVSVSRENVVDG
jgi:hypothetical protein